MTPAEIRALRERLKMTRAEFAARLGLTSRSMVARLESDGKSKYAPTGPLLQLLRELAGKCTENSRK